MHSSTALTQALALISFLALLNLSSSTPLDLTARQTVTPENCATGMHMVRPKPLSLSSSLLTALTFQFVAKGRGATNKNGRLQSLINLLKTAIPGTTVLSLTYDGTDNEVNTARVEEVNAITAYAASCPSTPIMLLGYSLGGIITLNSLCGASATGQDPSDPLDSTYSAQIIATVVYGEETYLAGQPYDMGTCTNNAPHPRQNPAGCDAFSANFASYCDADDPECCVGGTNEPAHLEYPQRYDTQARDFVVGRYNAYRGQ